MLKNSSKFTNAIKTDDREMKARVTINDIVYGDDMINNIEFSGSALSGEQFAIGSTHENTVKIEFSEVMDTIAPLDRVFVEIGVKRQSFSTQDKKVSSNGIGKMRMGSRLNMWNAKEDIEYSLMGEFYISEHVDVNRNDKITTIACKDKMIFLEGGYVSALKYPTDIRTVILEIANLSGVEIDTLNIEELTGIQVNKVEGHTYRQALGFLAQLLVGYVYFNRKGLLQIRKLSDSEYDITSDEYYSKGLTKNGIRYRVGGITCNVPDEDDPQELFVGSKMGPQLQIENPLMNKTMLQAIYNELKQVDYYPYDLEWFGNPAVEVGDLVTVYDVEGNEMKVPNLNYQLTYNGGLSATSSADTKSRTDIVASGRKTLQQQIHATQTKIKETATNLQNAFKDAQEKITGNQGGFIIQRMNEDGKPYEFLVMDTEDINSATNVIRLNQQGIGFSQNGYNGPFGVAITIDGQIVADYITAGTLRAELIQAGFNNIGDGYGVIITEDGLYSVAPSGEYSLTAEGGMKFYARNDVLNGSIESSYAGDKTGVGVFIEPDRSFSVVRNNPEGLDNKAIFEVPDDVDEFRLRAPFNAYGWGIDDAGVISAHSFRVKGTNQQIANISGGGGAYFDTQKVSLGVGDASGVSMKVTALPNKVEISEDLDMKTRNIYNVSNMKTYNNGRESWMFTDPDGFVALSGPYGAGIGYHDGAGMHTLLKFPNTGAMVAYRDLNMNGNSVTNQSDIRLKTNIKDADMDALREIERWRMINYEWDKSLARNKEMPDGVQFGLSAQSAPSLQKIDDKEDSYLSVDLTMQINVLTLGVQQLIKKVEMLEGELIERSISS